MTGYDVINRAMTLLGISGGENPAQSGQSAASLELINQLLSDLKSEPLSLLSGIASEDESKTEALCYGLAMLTALSMGDNAKNKLFTDLYNAKRSAALRGKTQIIDTLPKTTAGDSI